MVLRLDRKMGNFREHWKESSSFALRIWLRAKNSDTAVDKAVNAFSPSRGKVDFCEFEVSLTYIESSKTARLHQLDPVTEM